jgi:methylphosphotriester-DNA--protein-cysteine methyltransferase
MSALNRKFRKPTPPHLRPVYLLDPALQSIFEEVGPPYAATVLGWDDVERALADAPPSATLVAAPYAESDAASRFPALRRLLRRFASVPMLVALHLRDEVTGDLLMLLDWGVAEVISLGSEATPVAVRARLRQTHARPLKRRLEESLSQYTPAEARVVLRAAAEVAVEGGGAAELAARLEVSPRTAAARCGRAMLPPPRELQAWMRVLLGCLLLEDAGRTAAGAARAAGYTSDRSLRRATVRLLGTGTREVRRAGAFATAAARFDERLRALREAGRDAGER